MHSPLAVLRNRRFWSRIGVTIGEPIPPDQAEATALRNRILELRGEAL
ncbi:MAG: hypothetical protein ACYCW6_07675 [Candidatus Xenobia bacterium]